jgi:tripartite-type tricarboxylate transporter receptor subunit TctC
MKHNSPIRSAALAVLACAILPQAATADPVADFYKAKGLRIMLGHPPGGSYDLYARLAADHFRRFIPGAPAIIVEHKPGGGGVVATAFFYANAPRDGSVIALFPETIVHTQLLEPDVGKWKVQEMRYIGSFAPVNAAFVFRKGAPTLAPDMMRSTKTRAGCTGRNSQSYQYPAMLKNLDGFQFEIICGYKGSQESILAMERAEVDYVSSAWNSWRATHKAVIDRGEMIVAIQAGLRRDRELPDVPLMQELVSDPAKKKVIEFASAGAAIGRALITPPNTPADKLAALREAFDKMIADKDFLADAARRQIVIDADPGAAVDKVAQDIAAAPKELIDAASAAMK